MKNEDLSPYRKFGITLLQLMLIVFIIGVTIGVAAKLFG